jgi:hypothetical protein
MSNRGSNRVGRMNAWVAVIVIVAILVAAFLFWPGGDRPIGGNGGGRGATDDSMLELTRVALASTENLEVVEADKAWASLLQQFPADESIALNQAINRVLRVDQLSAQATNAALSVEEKQEARRQLPEAIAAARTSVDSYAALTSDRVTPLWLKARIDLHEASLLPGSMTRSLRREVFKRLSEAINGEIGKDPRSIILGGTLIAVVEQIEDPIDGLPDDVLLDATRTISELSNQHPDNLFFALRAARLNIDSHTQGANTFVQRAQQLAVAIEPSIRRETQPIGVTPDELVQQIITAVEAGNWPEAETRMLLWFNVLNSTEIVKTDRRRASPHPLDRLSFEALRRLSTDAAANSPVTVSSEPLAFEKSTIEGAKGVVALHPIDFDLDLDADLASLDESQTVTLWANQTSWERVGEVQLPHAATGLIAADLFVVDSSDPGRVRARPKEENAGSEPDYGSSVRHDTFQNLIAYGPGGVSVIRIDAGSDNQSVLQLVETPTGLEDVKGVVTAIAGDLEADGDLDLVFATETQGVRMFANRGNRTFFEILPGTGDFAKEDPVVSLAMADLDRDLDLDLVALHASGKVSLIENLLHLQFRGRFLPEITALEGAHTVSVEDIDGNVSWDLVINGSTGSQMVFSQTADAGAWTVARSESSSQAAPNTLLADLNNDSWLDLVTLSDASHWCSLGPWGFVQEGDWQPTSAIGPGQSPVVADWNRDGRIDIAAIASGGIEVYLNKTQSGHYLDVRFKGIDDNASGRVNHYAIGSVLELRFGPHYRARIANTPSTHFGIDGFDQSGTLRAILPNGLTQTIRDPKIDSLIEEEQTLKGSCPYLYAWDGEKFVFKTDCLWAAPLGLQVARGVVAKDRPWEYLKIDGSDIQPRGDRYEFRITEELWEVAYFDKVALSVVDHPADVEVWTNEKVGPPQIAEPTIFAFSRNQLHDVDSAEDTDGDDVSDKLAHNDRNFVQGFDRRLRQGLCPPHWIDLDFHSAIATRGDADAKIFLVLTGWILPTDTSLNIQIDQNPSLGPIEFPSVWVPDAQQENGWRKAIPYMGFPGGKTKTIVVDVTDVLIPDDPRLRIHTSAQIYWDSAKLAIQSEPARFHTEDVSLLAAEVTSHGFSRRIRTDATQPEWYDYQDASSTPRWPPLQGELTRLGECTELVREWDDAMVVISGGDEIRLEFSLPRAELPDGWVRDFVLHSIGWDKDADLNTLAGQSSLPLPFREMTAYPPLASEQERTDALWDRNQFHLQRTQSFRAFWHR